MAKSLRPFVVFVAKVNGHWQRSAGANIVAIGTLIEKSFEGGREALSYLDVPVESLAVVSSMDGDQINFSDD